ncbi:hypothetical protein BDV97DRAFT_362216 [Delphinella strobiligena]|nr:hypothetical protein BDV97DRAFT_362216 [Delphinella strobiligena]
MSLIQMHHSVCASCRLRSLIIAKQYARTRIPLPARWTKTPHDGIRRLHTSIARAQEKDARIQQANSDDVVRRIEEQLQILDSKLQAEKVARQAEHDFDLTTADIALPKSLEQETEEAEVEERVEHSFTPEQVARQARQQFGDGLPEDSLNAEEYKAYERLYGPPIRIIKAGEDEELVGFEENETQEELDEQVNVGTGILKEGKDGQLEELLYLEEELDEDEVVLEDEDDEVLEEVEEEAHQKLGPGFEGLDEKTLADLAALQVDDNNQAETDPGYVEYMRTHPLTAANRFGTPSSTVQLPKDTFVDKVSLLISGLPHKHVSETAHRVFGGPGLPYSTSTPRRGLTMPQKPIPLDPYQGRMSQMEADVYAATIMPGVYATAFSIMIETRKRLGSSWLEGLLNKEGGPLILDAGGAGAGVLAARQVLRAEWERMHDTSDDPESVMDLAEAGGKTGGESIPAPVGRATVLTGSESLRHRASALLDNTTFLPRLPDYEHASDFEARDRGKFDIIFAPHTLWQIREDYLRKQHIANLWSMLSNDGGVLILFEKGVPRGFEIVAAAREMLLDTRIASPGDNNPSDMTADIHSSPDSHGNSWGKAPKDKGMIIAPCTNHYECPMYIKGSGVSQGRKDHCHFNQRFIRPPFLQKILGAKDRNHEDVQFSYLSIMRGRDLRDPTAEGLIQGDRATNAAFTGYENPETHLQPNPPTEDPDTPQAFDPTAPAIDIDTVYGNTDSLVNEDGEPHSLCLPRAVMPPIKRHGHVILDLCTPSGTLERWTVPRSFSKPAYRDARKASWGDLWALGAKTRTPRNIRIGSDAKGVDGKGTLTVKGKSRKSADGTSRRSEDGKPRKGKTAGGPKNVIEVGYDAQGNIKEEDIKARNSGRMRSGPKIKGIRDKRDKKGMGNGRVKRNMASEGL